MNDSANQGNGGGYKGRTAEEWRAYPREYYQKNAERRRQQARKCYRRKAFDRAMAKYGDLVPKRVIRLPVGNGLATVGFRSPYSRLRESLVLGRVV